MPPKQDETPGLPLPVRRSRLAHPAVRRVGLGPTAGSYGWTGGLGSAWANDPHYGVVGVILTTDAFVNPFPMPAVIQDFWTGVYAALD